MLDQIDPALRILMADSKAAPQARADAFNKTYQSAGIQTVVGANGELSFSNVPGRDVYGPYMKQVAKTPEGKEELAVVASPLSGQDVEVRAAATAALAPEGMEAIPTQDGTIMVAPQKPNSAVMTQPVNMEAVFAQQYKAMAALTAPEEVANARASIVQATEGWLVDKSNKLRERAKAGQNIAALQAELTLNKTLDAEAYAKYGGTPGTMSAETEAVQNRLLQAEQRAEVEANRLLSADPEVAGARARLSAIDALYQTKLTMSFKELAQGADPGQRLGELIQPESIASIQLALGKDPAEPLDPVLEKELRLELASGRSGRFAKLEQIGATTDKPSLLMSAMAGGADSQYAQNVLNGRLQNPELLKRMSTLAQTNLAQAMAPAVGSDGKPLKVQTTRTKDEVEAARRGAYAKAVDQVARERTQLFLGSVNKWALPQDPELQAVVTSALEGMKAGEQEPSLVNLLRRVPVTTPEGKLDPVKIRKISDWFYSQAAQLPGNDFFGMPAEALDPALANSFIEGQLVANVARDTGLVGQAWDAMSPFVSRSLANAKENVLPYTLYGNVQWVNRQLFGSGQPISDFEATTNYYKGRTGVDPEWIQEREKQAAAARGTGQ